MKWIPTLLFLFILLGCKLGPNTNHQIKPKNNNPVFLFIGDSLTAGQGIPSQENFVSLLQRYFEVNKIPLQTLNAGISRETSAGTLKRIDHLIALKPKFIFLCIGSNDGLRGRSVEEYHQNLEQIVKKIKNANIKLILGGIRLYITKSTEYYLKIESVPLELSKKYSLLYYPFLLEGVSGNKNYFLRDGMHPNALGHQIIYERLNEFFKENNIY